MMLSRFAFRLGSATPAFVTAGQHRLLPVTVRLYSSEHKDAHAVVKKPAADTRLTVEQTIANWDAANRLYFGPERDHKNFPTPTMPMHSPPVRLGFIPETFFQFFYEKTGVTGPYVFGVGFLTFVLSKEIWIIEHGFTHFVSFWVLFIYLYRKFGDKIANYLDRTADAVNDRHWYKPMKKTVEQAEAVIKDCEKAIWREEGQKYLFEAKRENVDLQLESIYRQRLAEVHQAVKKRLDYQLEVENAERRLKQQHMVQWIVDSVVKGITPQQEKDSLAKCIQDLKTIAAKSAVA